MAGRDEAKERQVQREAFLSNGKTGSSVNSGDAAPGLAHFNFSDFLVLPIQRVTQPPDVRVSLDLDNRPILLSCLTDIEYEGLATNLLAECTFYCERTASEGIVDESLGN